MFRIGKQKTGEAADMAAILERFRLANRHDVEESWGQDRRGNGRFGYWKTIPSAIACWATVKDN